MSLRHLNALTTAIRGLSLAIGVAAVWAIIHPFSAQADAIEAVAKPELAREVGLWRSDVLLACIAVAGMVGSNMANKAFARAVVAIQAADNTARHEDMKQLHELTQVMIQQTSAFNALKERVERSPCLIAAMMHRHGNLAPEVQETFDRELQRVQHEVQQQQEHHRP